MSNLSRFAENGGAINERPFFRDIVVMQTMRRERERKRERLNERKEERENEKTFSEVRQKRSGICSMMQGLPDRTNQPTYC
jgi:hypothetical protein